MAKKAHRRERREQSLSRDRIIAASIQLLDRRGERGLTFRALSDRLATGSGAIYWHVANKNDLLTAACDALVVRTMNQTVVTTPKATIRAVALGLFPIVRILERIGQQIRALGVADDEQWAAVGTLMAYILGVSRQNAANRQRARARELG